MISRRLLLGGAAAAFGLPLLEAMGGRSARADAPKPPKRLIVMFVPNGWKTALFDPVGEGRDYTLSPCLQPLEAVRDRTLMLSGLDNLPGVSPVRFDEHSGCTSAFLTGSHRNGAPLAPNAGWSVDQILADAYGAQTPFPSLHLGSEEPLRCYMPGVCDGFEAISYRGHGAALPKDIFPASVYGRVFGGLRTVSSAPLESQLHMEQRLLDAAWADASSFGPRLGVNDQQRLDAWFQGISELRNRLGFGWTDGCTIPDAPAPDLDPTSQIHSMADLITHAFQCDKTRYVTWMLGEGRSERAFDFLGFPINHHDLSHEPGWTDAHIRTSQWFVEHYVYMVQRLASTPEPDGSTMLDNTLVLWGSPIHEGNRHDPFNISLLLGGGRGRTNERVIFPAGTPLARLHVSLLQAFGVQQDTFGDDGDGPLLDLSF